MSEKIYLQEKTRRGLVPSLRPYLADSLKTNFLVDAGAIDDSNRDVCRCAWVGFGIGKGVTHPDRKVSVFALPDKLLHGLHRELIDGLVDADPMPLCYDLYGHVKGFGGFIRWAYFANPAGSPDVLGIDWSLGARQSSGVVGSLTDVARVIPVLIDHGIPFSTEVVLLNSDLTELVAVFEMRQRAGLVTVYDWLWRASEIFRFGSGFCPRCGLDVLQKTYRYCPMCGARPVEYW